RYLASPKHFTPKYSGTRIVGKHAGLVACQHANRLPHQEGAKLGLLEASDKPLRFAARATTDSCAHQVWNAILQIVLLDELPLQHESCAKAWVHDELPLDRLTIGRRNRPFDRHETVLQLEWNCDTMPCIDERLWRVQPHPQIRVVDFDNIAAQKGTAEQSLY